MGNLDPAVVGAFRDIAGLDAVRQTIDTNGAKAGETRTARAAVEGRSLAGAGVTGRAALKAPTAPVRRRQLAW